MSRCRSCDAEILWVKTQSGKKMPVDKEPVPLPPGLFQLFAPANEEAYVRSAPALRTSHFATCPNADQHRSHSHGS
jgi:hypothetical protein